MVVVAVGVAVGVVFAVVVVVVVGIGIAVVVGIAVGVMVTMTIKFLHVRFLDPDTGEMSGSGGCTVAYTATKKDIMVHLAMCRVPDTTICGNWDPGDRFNYAIGREMAAGRLRHTGPLEVLARTDPMSKAIIEWLMKYLTITVNWDDVTNPNKPRWVSSFNRELEEPI